MIGNYIPVLLIERYELSNPRLDALMLETQSFVEQAKVEGYLVRRVSTGQVEGEWLCAIDVSWKEKKDGTAGYPPPV